MLSYMYAFVLSSARPARARGLRERRTKLTNGKAIAMRVCRSTVWPNGLAVCSLVEARHFVWCFAVSLVKKRK